MKISPQIEGVFAHIVRHIKLRDRIMNFFKNKINTKLKSNPLIICLPILFKNIPLINA